MATISRPPWPALAGVWLLAFAMRCLYLWQIHGAPFFDLRLGDAEAYHLWAQRIAVGDWLGNDVFYQSPLYPYFLGLIYRLLGESALTVRLVQAAIGASSCALLAVGGATLFPRMGILAGVGLALYPPAIFLDGLLEKSVLVTFFTTALLAMLALQSGRHSRLRWLATGIIVGLLGLTRENALLLVVPVLCWIWLGRSTGIRRTAAALLFAGGCAAILLPVALRNRAVGGELHLTTSQFGPNFYIGNHQGATGTYDALVIGHGSARDERADATRLAEEASGRKLRPGEVSRYWTGRAIDYIRSQPGDWLRLMGRKLALTFNAAEVADTESLDVYAEWSGLLRALQPFTFGVLLAAAIAGAIVTWPSRRQHWFLYALAGTYALSVVLFYVFARYRFPLVPVLMILAAGGVARARSRSGRALIVAAAAGVLSLTFTTRTLDDRRAAVAAHYAGIATALAEERAPGPSQSARQAQAMLFYERALQIAPDFPAAQFGYATLLSTNGRHDEALPRYRAAIRAWPSYAEAHYNLGISLAQTGRVEDAADAYREALRLRPDDVAARQALANTLLALGRPELAIVEYEHSLKLQPERVGTLTGLGIALAQSGRVEDALKVLRRAVALDPASAAAHNNLGWTLATEGHVAEAIPHFERALELNPQDENARKNLERARQLSISRWRR
jgi:tetratricopeptide (TPR) repeat protein